MSDYIGFTYNNVHSDTLGIKRVSDGSRFNENLLPTMQDKTVQVPGGDGTYYFGSYYTQRQFNISFAFDSLTEQQIATLKSHFGDKQIHDLIFDETPYKVYSAKVTGTATLKYIPFAEGETNRVYKGEGTIQFTCYYPFARCKSTDPADYITKATFDASKPYEPNKYYYLNTTTNKFELDSGASITNGRIYYSNIDNINEWWAASRIGNSGNFGDIPVPFIVEFTTGQWFQINGDNLSKIECTLPSGVTKINLNTKTGVAKVIESTNTSYAQGAIANQFLTGNLTQRFPVGATVASSSVTPSFTCLYI